MDLIMLILVGTVPTAYALTLAPGDTLLLFSDGISEAENSDLLEYGEERLVESMAAERHSERKVSWKFLLTSVGEFVGGHRQSDDITALVVRCPLMLPHLRE